MALHAELEHQVGTVLTVMEADGLNPEDGTYRPVLHVRVSPMAADAMRHLAQSGIPLRLNGAAVYFLPFTSTRPRARTSHRPATAYAAAHEAMVHQRGRGWAGGHVHALRAKRTPLGSQGSKAAERTRIRHGS